MRAESCRRCAAPAEKKEEVKLQIKKINIMQKSATVQKPKLAPKKPASASPSEARTKNL
nr:MAG TPA: hypothetical protein [Caudoviricetes sp.]